MSAAVLGGIGMSSAAAADSCPNAAIRAQQGSENLPDCRAYEQVSAAEKYGYNAEDNLFRPRISADGTRVFYSSLGGFADSETSVFHQSYFAERTGGGWSSTVASPRETESVGAMGNLAPLGLSPDIRQVFLKTYYPFDQADTTPLPLGTPDIYKSSSAGSPEWISRGSIPQLTNDPYFDATNADGSVVVFQTSAHLEPADVARASGTQVYERADGQTYVVGVDNSGSLIDPSGAVTGNGILGTHQNHSMGALSRDGRRIIFQSPPGLQDAVHSTPYQVYQRVDHATTLNVSASERTPVDPAGTQDALWQDASADGTRIFFSTTEQLINSDTDSSDDLYEYDVDRPVGARLTRITDGTTGTISVVGVSDDGSRIYYVDANQTGAGVFSSGTLYLHDSEGTRAIAALSDDNDVQPGQDCHGGVPGPCANHWGLISPGNDDQIQARLTPDGRFLLFGTRSRLKSTDIDNNLDFYRYDAATGDLTQVSVGAGPDLGNGPFDAEVDNKARANGMKLQARNFSDDGQRVFFQTDEPLVEQDGNGATDVYEWEQGQIHLISDGTQSTGSTFKDATPDGNNVLFTTKASLVAQDVDGGLFDVYDARVDGGYPAPVVAQPCSGDSCQGQPTRPPDLPAAGSVSFVGARNTSPGARKTLRVGKPSMKARRRAARTGNLVVAVRTSKAGKVSAVAKGRIGKRTRRVARKSVQVRKAGKATLRLRLNRAARQRLKSGRNLKLTIQVLSPGARSRSITVRLPGASS